MAGYAIFALGSVLELTGYGVGLAMSIRGGLFEIAAGCYLLGKGFRQVGFPRVGARPGPEASAAGAGSTGGFDDAQPGVQAVDPSLKTTECTAAELSAAAEPRYLAARTPAPQFKSVPVEGRTARFSSTLTSEKVLSHYRLAAKNAGWEVEDRGEVVADPGQEPRTPRMGSLYMNKDQMSVELLSSPLAKRAQPARGTG